MAGSGIFQVRVEFAGVQRLVKEISGDIDRVGPAILNTHTFLAKTLQDRQAKEMARSVADTGRAQRNANIDEGPLYQAIVSPENRSVTERGFTVGFLGDEQKFGRVGLYALNLDRGTGVHVGDRFRGYWVTAGGEFVGPHPEGRDVRIAAVRNGERPGGFFIKKSIVGYHFQKAGFEQWKADGYNYHAAIEAYADFMDAEGLVALTRMFRPSRHSVIRH